MIIKQLIQQVFPNIQYYNNKQYSHVVKWTFYKHRVVYVGYGYEEEWIMPKKMFNKFVNKISSYIYNLPLQHDNAQSCINVYYSPDQIVYSIIFNNQWDVDNYDIHFGLLNAFDIDNLIVKTKSFYQEKNIDFTYKQVNKVTSYLHWVKSQLCLLELL